MSDAKPLQRTFNGFEIRVLHHAMSNRVQYLQKSIEKLSKRNEELGYDLSRERLMTRNQEALLATTKIAQKLQLLLKSKN
jgi:hypothetical protein|tara:strand:+ start:457 stop:696 length:240 start_codon:yes stop_codon:yes gene_type:complete